MYRKSVPIATILCAGIVITGLVLPTNSDYNVPVGEIFLKPAEIMYLFLPVFNAFRPRTVPLKTEKIRSIQIASIVALTSIFFTEFILKSLLFSQPATDGLRSIQIGLPLVSAMMLVAQGPRMGNSLIWKAIVVAVGISVALSVLSIFVNMPIYSGVDAESTFLELSEGRLLNSNASFGFVALLVIGQLERSETPRFKGDQAFLLLSIFGLFLTFSRTYIALTPLSIIIFYRKSLLKFNVLSKTILTIASVIVLTAILYKSNETIQAQIDRRFIADIAEMVSANIEGTRDVIWGGAIKRIKEGYWVIGLPFKTEIFISKDTYLGFGAKFPKTDTSLINLLLRYGIVPTIAVLVLLLKMSKDSGRTFRLILLIYIFASVNIDSLVSHNAIFFLIMTDLVIREGRRRKELA